MSGSAAEMRSGNLGIVLSQTMATLRDELDADGAGKALVIVNSYREAEDARDRIEQEFRRKGQAIKVAALVRNNHDHGEHFVPRSEVYKFCDHPAKVLSVSRPWPSSAASISSTAAAMPCSRASSSRCGRWAPHDLGGRYRKLNGLIERGGRRLPGQSRGVRDRGQASAWRTWKTMERDENLPMGAWRTMGRQFLVDDAISTLMVTIIQIFGRLARLADKERPAPHVYFADAAFRGGDGSSRSGPWKSSAPTMERLMHDSDQSEVAKALYGPFYESFRERNRKCRTPKLHLMSFAPVPDTKTTVHVVGLPDSLRDALFTLMPRGKRAATSTPKSSRTTCAAGSTGPSELNPVRPNVHTDSWLIALAPIDLGEAMQRHRGLDLLPQRTSIPNPRLPQGDGDAAPRDVRGGRACRGRSACSAATAVPWAGSPSPHSPRKSPTPSPASPRTRQRHGRELQAESRRGNGNVYELISDIHWHKGGSVGVRPQIPRRDAAGRPQGKGSTWMSPSAASSAKPWQDDPFLKHDVNAYVRTEGGNAPRRPLRLRQTEARLGLGPRGPGELRVRQRDRIALQSARVS